MKVFIVPLLFVSVSASYAVPTIYPKNADLLSSIKNPTNSNIVSDDNDLKRFYVMPPNTASGTSQGLHTLGAMGFCDDIAETEKGAKQFTVKINELALEDANTKIRVNKIREELYKARKAQTEYATSKNLVPLHELDTRISNLELRLNELYKFLETCQNNCESINQEIHDVNIDKTNLMKERRSLAQAHSQDIRQYEKLKDKVNQININLEEENESYNVVRKRLMKAKNELLEMFNSYSKMYGGRSSFHYHSNWDDNIQSLSHANPGFHFERIQTANAKVFTALNGLSPNIKAESVLAYEIPGIKSSEGIIEFSSYPPDFSANLVLSLPAVCQIKYPELFQSKTIPNEESMKYGLIVAFEFPSSFNLSAIANYNMHKMYTKTVSSGSSGGFFSSRSWTDVSENTDFNDAFSIAWKNQDPGNTISEDQRIALEQEMKVDIYKRMLALSLPLAQSKAELLSPSSPSAHGAVVISDSLMRVCPVNVYCVGASLALSVLDAFFGSSSAVANYTSTQDFNLTNSWSSDKVVMKPWITSYIPENNK